MMDWSRLKRTSIQQQGRTVGGMQRAMDPCSVQGEISVLFPDVLRGRDFRRLLDAVVKARKEGLPVLVLYGAHVLKVGLGPLLVEAMRHGIVTGLATNGAGLIHDAELARFGRTSEDVAAGLVDGSFGMAIETGRDVNLALREGVERGLGLGQAVGEWLCAQQAPWAGDSPLAAACELGLAATVHVAIGTDILHQHPEASGAALGEGSLRDFHRLCEEVGKLRGGGVVLCFGSAVILPEVFLKAVTVARNLDAGVGGFTTAVFDMIDHYRARTNVAERPPAAMGGTGYRFVGHHELLLPILFHDLFLRVEKDGSSAGADSPSRTEDGDAG